MNDYAIMHNKVSEFLYKPITEKLEGLGLRREVFIELSHNKFWKRTLKLQSKVYIKKVQKPLMDHREEMSKMFNNRIDYVDLSAFGVGVDAQIQHQHN